MGQLGFKDGATVNKEYKYDENGNIRLDRNKGALASDYNYLNLPKQIGQMTILYDALGRKWSKTGESGTVYYIDGFEFRNGQLEAVYAPDGRLVPDEGASGPTSIDLRAEYWRQDHTVKNGVKGPRSSLTRVTFSDFNQNGRVDVVDNPTTIENELEITQESHYYPFGLQQEGDWHETVAPENKYLYNGKELSEDYGIDLYAYGARWYDPALGRFTGVDPLAAKYAGWSPYNYVMGNPISLIDPDGRSSESIHKNANGEVIAEFDDGDNNVYVHNDLGKDGQHIDGQRGLVRQRREVLGTSGGGEVAWLASAKNKISKLFGEGTQDAEAYHNSGDSQPGGLEVHMGAGKNSSGILKNSDAENGSSGIVDGIPGPAGGGASSAFGLPNFITTVGNYHEGVGTKDKPWTDEAKNTFPGDTVQCPSCNNAVIQGSSGSSVHPGRTVNVPDPTQYPSYNPKKK